MGSLWKFCAVITLSLALGTPAHSAAVHFKREKIEVGSKKITIEIAETPAQHEYGLMNRQTLKPDEGMLFVFPEERILGFWMKNTFVDLSIGFFNAQKVLVDIQEMKAVSSIMAADVPTYHSASPAKYALEMNKGWFSRNKIKVGDKLKFKVNGH